MVATITIRRLTGAACSQTSSDITCINTRANAADSHSTNCTSNPIILSCSTVYSYWVVTRLHATVAPDNLVDNVKWFTDGCNSYGSCITLQVGQACGYTQATGACGSGTLLNNTNYSTGTLAPACPGADNAFCFVTCSPLSVTGSTSSTGEFGNYVIYQVAAGASATPGTKPATPETITWRYDET